MLVLLSTSSNKLLAQWQGPYCMLRKVRKVNYEVDMLKNEKFPCEHAKKVAPTRSDMCLDS